ncbi:MAG: 50S ribosomal protein L4 [Bacteroidota bacterium]|nr:50S ribosomal protein L4 [Bacteroidota bacterium]
MELEVFNIKGEKTTKMVTLADEIFAIEPNDHVIYLDVKRIQNANRQGTHKAKERNELRGSTRKLIKQKGSGGARRGDIKSPLLRGGGRVFGPRVRDYDIKLNKKVKSLARRSALAYKAINNQIVVVENFDMAVPKTKEFTQILSALNLTDNRSLFVIGSANVNIMKSASNIQNANIALPSELNTYSLLHAQKLILTEDAVNIINETLK